MNDSSEAHVGIIKHPSHKTLTRCIFCEIAAVITSQESSKKVLSDIINAHEKYRKSLIISVLRVLCAVVQNLVNNQENCS